MSEEQSSGRRRGLRALIALATVLEVAGTWLRSGHVAGRTLVRCRQGHLFTTLWIPLVSIKSLRLGWWRLQRCPVGRHWSIVTPVRQSELSEAEVAAAAEHRDLPLP
ncbi:MAG: hypothetical protein ACRDMJ_15045 [Solirubrobacteraceae bacterium]